MKAIVAARLDNDRATAWKSLQVSDEEFHLFQRLVYEASGIYLSPMKRALLAGRLSKRIRQLGLTSLSDYYREVIASGEGELQIVLDNICTNETSFFREPAQFDFLDQVIIPSWLAGRERSHQIRVWSAGCATGEEPFSLAMLLHRRLVSHGWSVRIVATDLSRRALDRAARAVWPIQRAAEIPEPYLRAFMLKSTDSREGLMKAGPSIRSLVEFRTLNLNDAVYGFERQFDLLFCRNVMIYFDADAKHRVVARMLQHLVPGGYFFFGHSESAAWWGRELVPVRPAIACYQPEAK